jgi:hypothetical protein
MDYKSITSNFLKLNLITIARNSMFLMPIMVLFFTDLGLSLSEVFILQSIFAFSVVVLEIPTWYIGDILRRKDWLIIWSICWTVWYLWLDMAQWFWTLALAEVFLALGYTFYSGSDSALIYDTLAQIGKEDTFQKIKWRYMAFWNFSEAWGAIIWWALVLYGYEWVTLWQVIMGCVGCLITVTLVEPNREKYEVTETWFKHLFRLVKYALYTNSTISALVVYSAITGLATMFWVWLAQPYWDSLWIPLFFFWILRAVWNASVWFFSRFAYRTIWKFGNKKLLIILPLLSVLTYIVFWISSIPAVLVMMLTFYASRWILWVVYYDLINKLVTSKERATILSVKSLAFRGLFMIFGPIVWLVADMYNIQTAMFSAWLISFILLIIWLLLMKRNWLFDPQTTIA